MRLTITIEPDEVGGYRAIIEDWYTRAGHGNTPSEAIAHAAESASDWLDADEQPDLYDHDLFGDVP